MGLTAHPISAAIKRAKTPPCSRRKAACAPRQSILRVSPPSPPSSREWRNRFGAPPRRVRLRPRRRRAMRKADGLKATASARSSFGQRRSCATATIFWGTRAKPTDCIAAHGPSSGATTPPRPAACPSPSSLRERMRRPRRGRRMRLIYARRSAPRCARGQLCAISVGISARRSVRQSGCSTLKRCLIFAQSRTV